MEEISMPRNPPPKPKRNNNPGNNASYDMDGEYADENVTSSSPVRRGRNNVVPRHNANAAADISPPTTPDYNSHSGRPNKIPIVDMEPETTIGPAVKMKGDLSFERLLRIEGEFEGKLISKGSLVIGTKGHLIGNVESMKEVYITGGKLVGNVQVDKLVLRDKAQVFGNITAKTLKMDADCVVVGTLNVNPHAPEKINEKGEVLGKDGHPSA